MIRLATALLVVLALTRAAHADVCVQLDESRDTLPPEDRRAAAISFAQALAKNGVVVTNQNCTETYIVYNVKLGDSITAYVVSPRGQREARADKIDELSLVYEQMAHSLVTGEPMGTGGDSVDRTNATTEQMAPRRVSADDMKFVRLGYGGVTGRTSTGGTAFGLGYRYELDKIAVEVSALNIILPTDSQSRSAGVTGSWLRLSGYYFLNPLANETTYVGAGLGWGASAIYDHDTGTTYSGSGLDTNLTLGYEMLRASTLRLFGQVDVTLPTYMADGRWIPSVTLSLGIGWGKSNTIAVVSR